MVFPWRSDEVLICDIIGRGWCIPSGRVEPNEDSAVAVTREAVEEAGALLESVQYIGAYHIQERQEIRWADVYVAHVHDLVDIQIIEESQGRRFFRLEELPEFYHQWSDLTEQVFAFSREVYERMKPRETSPLLGTSEKKP